MRVEPLKSYDGEHWRHWVINSARRRWILLACALCCVWSIEALLTRGPLALGIGNAFPSIITDLIFTAGFVVGILVIGALPTASRGPRQRRRSPRSDDLPLLIQRLPVLIALAVVIIALQTGAARYDPVLGNFATNKSVVGLIWGPVAIGASACVLTRRSSIPRMDWFLLLSLAVLSSSAGGRTVPGMILLMVLIRFFVFLDFVRPRRRRLSVRAIAVLGIVALLALALFSSLAQSRSEKLGSSGRLATVSYAGVPAVVRPIAATLGVIGESARVAHVVIPVRFEPLGAGLLVEDVLSFLPGYSRTVTAATVDMYGSLGSVVFVSRPGGTPTTFYMLGGNVGALVGGCVYGILIFLLLIRGVLGGRPGSSACYLILAATFALGFYGTGTPTSSTLLAAGFSLFFLVIVPWAIRFKSAFGPSVHPE